MKNYVINDMLTYQTISTTAVLATLGGTLVVGAVTQPSLDDIAALIGPGQPQPAVGAFFFCLMSFMILLLLWRPIVKHGLVRFERVGLAALCLCMIPLIVWAFHDSGVYWAGGLILPAWCGAASFSALAAMNAYRIWRPSAYR